MRQGGFILAAGRVRSKKKTTEKKHGITPDPPKTHYEIHSSPTSAFNSRGRSRKHIPDVSSYASASMDPDFVEIGLVQLSQSVKTTNVTHTDTQTDQINNGTLYAPRYEDTFLPIGKKRPQSLRSLGLASL